jgi:hypothetical protein
MVKQQQLYGSFVAAVQGVEEAIADGWQVDWDNPPDSFVFQYEVSYTREDEAPIKRTRAEILADARAAKAAKKVGE